MNVSNPVWAGITQKRTLGREFTKNHRLTVECIHKAFGEGWQKKIRYWFSKEQKTKQSPIQYRTIYNPNGAASWIHHAINYGDATFVKKLGLFGVWRGCNCVFVISPCFSDVCILPVHSVVMLGELQGVKALKLLSWWKFHVHGVVPQSHLTEKMRAHIVSTALERVKHLGFF